MNEPLRLPEAAKILKIPPHAIRRLCRDGVIKTHALRHGGVKQHKLIYPDQLLKYAKKQSFPQDVIKAINKLVG